MFTSTQDSKPSNKTRKDKKKERKNKRNSTHLIIGGYVTQTDNKKRKKKDINKTTYYNYDKRNIMQTNT